jgi:hypothetical protein
MKLIITAMLIIFITTHVKHGFVQTVKDWQYSSFHRWVARGFYPLNWTTDASDNNWE